jgi:hypothetical protein
MMRRFGRQCRGLGNVLVTLVRQTETRLWELGAPVLPLAQAAQASLHGATHVSAGQRVRLDTQLPAALEAHHRSACQSRRLTQGKGWSHGKIVNAYDPTIAPIGKGKSTCPAPFGRKPGMIAEPAAGFSCARHLPVGNPSDVKSVEPLVDNVEQAITRVRTRPVPTIHSLAGDLALNDAALRCRRRGFSRWESRKALSPFLPRLRQRTSLGAWTRRTCTPDAPRPRCTAHTPVWVQPTRGRTPHGQPVVSWGRASQLQRPSWCDRPTGDGRHGAPRGDIGAHPRVPSVEAGAHVPPMGAFEVPSSQSLQCLNTLVVTT